MTDTGSIVVFITAGSHEESVKISELLLKKKKAACVTIVPGVNSMFLWKGKIDTAQENLLIVKTRAPVLEEIIQLVMQVHSYDVPEIIAMPVVGGSEDYLNWIDAEVR